MVEDKEKEKKTASLNGGADLEGKTIIDAAGDTIGICKAVNIDEDGQIGLIFETEINEKKVTPSQTIPYSAIGKITDKIQLRIPINLKVAQSTEEIDAVKKQVDRDEKKTKEKKSKKNGKEEKKTEKVDKAKEIVIQPQEEKKKAKVEDKKEEIEETEKKQQPRQADATQQLLKTIEDEGKEEEEEEEEKEKAPAPTTRSTSDELIIQDSSVKKLTQGLEEAAEKIDQLFNLLVDGKAKIKIDAINALTYLTKISPELGLTLIPKMMKLNDEPQQDVRLAIAKNLQIIGQTKPELFKGYFLELLENTYEEPIEEIREQLSKALHDIAMKIPEMANEGLEEFLIEVVNGERVPEVPSKVLHDVTLRIVSGNFLLTRSSIRVRLQFIAKGGKLGKRCAEELEDYNATLIGLTMIESFEPSEAEELLENASFSEIGPVFFEVIQQMIKAYKEGSFELLEEVVDKKIEIPSAVIERVFEIKIQELLKGIQSAPMEVVLENSIIDKEEAEQIIYRLVVQKKINAAITMNNGKMFISSLEEKEQDKKKTTSKKKDDKTDEEKTAAKKTADENKENKKPTKSNSTKN
jgi:hypothetical protein